MYRKKSTILGFTRIYKWVYKAVNKYNYQIRNQISIGGVYEML